MKSYEQEQTAEKKQDRKKEITLLPFQINLMLIEYHLQF